METKLWFVLMVFVVILAWFIIWVKRLDMSWHTYWLCEHIKANNVKGAKKHRNDKNLDYRDNRGRTILFLAIANQAEFVVEMLLEDGNLEDHRAMITVISDRAPYVSRHEEEYHMLEFALLGVCSQDLIQLLCEHTSDLQVLQDAIKRFRESSQRKEVAERLWSSNDRGIMQHMQHRLWSMAGHSVRVGSISAVS